VIEPDQTMFVVGGPDETLQPPIGTVQTVRVVVAGDD
jgi:hypothetical protein